MRSVTPDAAAHVKRIRMCAESRLGRATLWLRKSLAGMRLCHGLRGGGAAPETEAVAVATPLFRCPLWHQAGLGCALHPTPRGGALRVHQSLAGRQAGARGGCVSSFVEAVTHSTDWQRNPDGCRRVGADADRGVGAKAAVGGRSQRPRDRSLAGERRVQLGQRRQPEEDRVHPSHPKSGVRTAFPPGIVGAGATRGGREARCEFPPRPEPVPSLRRGGLPTFCQRC